MAASSCVDKATNSRPFFRCKVILVDPDDADHRRDISAIRLEAEPVDADEAVVIAVDVDRLFCGGVIVVARSAVQSVFPAAVGRLMKIELAVKVRVSAVIDLANRQINAVGAAAGGIDI